MSFNPDDPTANLAPPDDTGSNPDPVYQDTYDAPAQQTSTAAADDPTANLATPDDNQKVYHDPYDVAPETTAAAQQVDAAPAYHSDPTANLSGAAGSPQQTAGGDPTANLSTPPEQSDAMPRQNDNRSIWDRAKDLGKNALSEAGHLAEIPTLPARAAYEQATSGEGFDPTQFLSDTFGKAAGDIGGVVKDAFGVGSRIQGSAAVAANDLRRGNWDQTLNDINPASNAYYAVTGDQAPWMSDQEFNVRNVVSRNPAAAILPGTGGSGEAGIYDVPVIGGVARAEESLRGALTPGSAAQGPSLDVGALQDDLANGMSVQEAMRKYQGSVGAQIVSDLINPANFVEVPGVAEAVSGIFERATLRNLAGLAEKADAAGAWAPELSQDAARVLEQRGTLKQGGIFDTSAPNTVNGITETVVGHTPGLGEIATIPGAAVSLEDGAGLLATGDVARATAYAERHAATYGGAVDGALDVMQQIADGVRANLGAKGAVSPDAVASYLSDKARGIEQLGTDLRDVNLRKAADQLRIDLAQATQPEKQAAAALAARDLVQQDIRAAWYARGDIKLPGTESAVVQGMQGIANVFRGMMLAASAPPLALQKFTDEWFRAMTQGTLAIRASDTAIGQAIGRFGEKRGNQLLTDFRAGGTVNRLLDQGVLPPSAALADVNPLTFRSAFTGQNRYGQAVSGIDRFQALGAPIDKWNQSLIAAPTQHVVLNALYQDTKGLAAARQQFARQAAQSVLDAGAPLATAQRVLNDLAGAQSNSDFLRVANGIAGLPGFEGGAAQARRIVEAAPPTVPDAAMARGAVAREQGNANVAAARAPLAPFDTPYAPSQRVAENMAATGGPQGFVKEVTKLPLPRDIAPAKYADTVGDKLARVNAELHAQPINQGGSQVRLNAVDEMGTIRFRVERSPTGADRWTPDRQLIKETGSASFDTLGEAQRHLEARYGGDLDSAGRIGRGIDLAAGGDGGAGYLSRQQRSIRDDLNAMGGFGTGRTLDMRTTGAPEPRGGKWRSDQAKEIADKIDSGEMTVARARQIVARAEGHTPSPEAFEYLKDLGQAARLSRSLDPAWESIYQDLHQIRGRTYPGDIKPVASAPEPAAGLSQSSLPTSGEIYNDPVATRAHYAEIAQRYPDAPIAGRTAGWKLHLNTPEDLANPNTREIAQYLKDQGVPFKVGKGGESIDGKGMTIYIGGKDEARAIAQDLEARFGGKIGPPVGDVLNTNQPFTKNITGRFDTYGDPAFAQYGRNGTPLLAENEQLVKEAMLGRAKVPSAIIDAYYRNGDAAAAAKYGELYTGRGAATAPTPFTRRSINEPAIGSGNVGEPITPRFNATDRHDVQAARDAARFAPEEATPFTRAPEPRIGVDTGMRDIVGRPPEGARTPFDPTADLGTPVAPPPRVADPTAGLGGPPRGVPPALPAAGFPASPLPQGDLAAAQAGVRQAGQGFANAPGAAINAGLERGYRIVGNNADQTTAGSWMKNGIGGVTPPILPFAPFHIHSAQFWASYFSAHPALMVGMAQVLQNLDDYGTLHLPGGATVAGLIKLTTGLHVLEWAQRAYEYHTDVAAAGNNNLAQTLLKDFAYSGVGNNAFARPFEYVGGPIQSITQSATNPLLAGDVDKFTGQPKIDKRDILREYGTMAGTTGVGQTLNDITGGNVPRNVISGLTNPGQALGNQLQRGTDAGLAALGMGVDRTAYKPEMAEAHALGKVADSLGLTKYTAEKAYYNPETPQEIALGKQLRDAVHLSLDTQAIGKLAPVQVNGPQSAMEAKGIFAPTKLANMALDQEIAPGFTAKDLLGQPGNYYDTLAKIDAAKSQYGANSPQAKALEGELAKIRAADVAQASGVLGPYFDQLHKDSLAKNGDQTFRGGLKPNEQSAYDAFNDLRRSADYQRYVELEKQQAAAGPFGSAQEKAWYKANVTELNRLKDVIAGAETSIVSRYGVNPKELSNRAAVAAGYSPTYSDTTIKGSTPQATGSGSPNASNQRPSPTYGNSRAASGASAGGQQRSATFATTQKAGNDFYDFYKGLTSAGEKAVVQKALDASGFNPFGQKGVTAQQYERALTVAQVAVEQARTKQASATSTAGGSSGATPRSIPGFIGRHTDAEMAAALAGTLGAPDWATLGGTGGGRLSGGSGGSATTTARTAPANLPGGSGVPAGYFRGKDGKLHPSKFAA